MKFDVFNLNWGSKQGISFEEKETEENQQIFISLIMVHNLQLTPLYKCN